MTSEEEAAMAAAFRAGWAAACLTIASDAERNDAPEIAAALRKLAMHPANVVVRDLATEEGRALKGSGPTVYMEEIPIGRKTDA